MRWRIRFSVYGQVKVATLSREDFDLLRALRERIVLTRLQERGRYIRELDRLFARRERGNDFDGQVQSLSGDG